MSVSGEKVLFLIMILGRGEENREAIRDCEERN